MIKNQKIPTKLNLITEKIQQFFAWKYHYWITLPLYFILLYVMYFIFAFKTSTYVKFPELPQEVGFASYASYLAFIILLVLFVVLIGARIALKRRNKTLKAEDLTISFVMIGMSVLILFSYLRFMNTNLYKHDWSLYEKGGHFSIIYDIFNTGKWPDANMTNQYYQPKVWHTVVALFMKLNSFIIPHFSTSQDFLSSQAQSWFPNYDLYQYTLLETSRILMAYYGSLTIFFGYKIFKLLGLKGSRLVIASFLISFTPVMYYLPFYGNNDSLSFFFGVMALFFALKYKEKQNFRYIVLTAVGIGLSMATKLNNAVIAVPIAFIFLLVLIQTIKKINSLNLKKFILQIAVFAVIVFPLGLAIPIYHKIAFDMPFGYVLDLETNGENWMHIDQQMYNPIVRFFLFPTPDLFFSITNLRYNSEYVLVNGVADWISKFGEQDFNVWTSFLKTALWGEGGINASKFLLGICYVLYAFAILLGVAFIVFFWIYVIKTILNLCKKDRTYPSFGSLVMLLTFLTTFVSYAYFNYRYPVGCSANARYAMFMFFPLYYFVSDGAVNLVTYIKGIIKNQHGQPDQA